jgi:hypothetical protein
MEKLNNKWDTLLLKLQKDIAGKVLRPLTFVARFNPA